MRLLITFFCLGLSVATGTAQQQVPSAAAKSKVGNAPAAAQSGSLTPSGLNTDNLNYGDDIKRIYVGDFEHVSFKRDSTNFTLMVDTYMTEYSKSCDRYLPKDKVQIMKTVCSNQVATVNQFGTEVDARRCTQYDTVGTGRYADPRVYALHKTLDSSINLAVLQAYVQDITQKPGNGPGLRQMTDIGTYVLQDGNQFLVDNACSSAATMRYQENMLHFGRGEAAIRMAGAADLTSMATIAKLQNYKGLVDDLITEESKSWAMNHYLGGSAVVTAVNHNGDGSPKEIDAKYILGNKTPGKVRITFGEDEMPCLYFSDQPTNCRIPSPKLVAAFRRNKYADPTAPVYPEIAPFDDAPGWVEARAKSFQKMQDDVAAANARRAAGDVSPQAARAAEMRAMARPGSPASVASAVRSGGPGAAGSPFSLAVRTVDPITEVNVGSGAVFRATVERSTGLSNGQVPAGAVVSLKVLMEQQSPGSRATNDVYNILLDKVEVDGKTIPLQSKPIRLIRRANTSPPLSSQADYSAINVGTVLNFYGTQP
ncbi:MAG TPA: hypothetical protein VHW70_08640 [Edaphobacter sp.]|nr:hypothetical protein [Edaphobacter sp.]